MQNSLDYELQNEKIQDTITANIVDAFPITGRNKVLELKGLTLTDTLASNDFPYQKEIKLNRRSWTVPAYAHLVLRDKASGQVLDERKKMKIANVPKLTNRFSVIVDGNEYQTQNQFRLKPGVYTRVKANKELESRFNLEKGYNFTMIIDPEKGMFYLVLGNKKFYVYNILALLGVADVDIEKLWGGELFRKNKKAGLNNEMADILALYEKLFYQKAPDESTARKELIAYFDRTKVSPETTKITLGQAFDKVTGKTILATSRKLLAVMRGDEEPDERDSLAFKELYSVDDLLSQYFKAKGDTIKNSIKGRLNTKSKLSEILSSSTYSQPLREFFTVSDLSATPPQLNPLDILNEWRKTTVMGTGGVTSRHAITMDVRDVHPSHLGFLDPLNTPESGKVGVVVGLTIDAEKHGPELKTHVILKSGKKKLVTPTQLFDMKIGFPDQFDRVDGKPVPRFGMVKATFRGRPQLFKASEIDAYIPSSSNLFSYSSNTIPFLHHNSGNRGMTASRQMGQALSIKGREAPLVQTLVSPKRGFGYLIGNYLNPMPGYENKGTVTKITDDYVHIKRDKDGKTAKIGLYNYFPLNQESYLHSIPRVKIGDKVDEDTVLADNNFSKDQTLALGSNVRVAYMNWHGLNFEDSCVVTDSFAKKFTSSIMVRKSLMTSNKGLMDKRKFRTYYPNLLTMENAEKLDENGIAKLGQTFHQGEIIVSYMEKFDETNEEKILRMMNKLAAKPFRPKVLKWDHDHPGTVKYVNRVGKKIDVRLIVDQPLVVGDKIAGSHGNKAIVSRIIPDDEAPHTLDGNRVDLMLNPHGVPGRINPGQLIETAAGKIATKTGKPYLVRNFDGINYTKKVVDELKANKIPANEVLTDGKDGKPFRHPVFTGKQYFHKLQHTVEHKMKSRSAGQFESYDINQQPPKGEHAGQNIDALQMYAYLAHGAKENLYEATALKGQKNDEFWRNLMLGLPTPKPTQNFVFDKMVTYLKGASVNVDKNGNRLQLLPLLDEDVKNMSAGELKDAGAMLRGKNLVPRPGGLFDREITGGANGKNWSHIELNRRIPNPMFEDAIIKLLNISGPMFRQILDRKEELNGLTGPEAIDAALKNVDVDSLLGELKDEIKAVPDNKVNYYNKRIRYLEALKKFKMKPEQYMMSTVPVIPPVFRPIYNLPSGDLMVSPVNHFYSRVAMINKAIEKIDEAKLPEAENYKNISELYQAIKQMQGLAEPARYLKQKYEGLLSTLIGKEGKGPKEGFIQNKVWSKSQDVSARSTITLDPSLGIDEAGVPNDISKTLYKPFIIRELVRQGIPASGALKHIQNWTPQADLALTNVMQKRPVILNRAPSLHKHGVQAFKPVRVDGKSIRLNPLVVTGFNADFDGDAMMLTLPVQRKAIDEAWGMLPSNIPFKAGDFALVPQIAMEYMLGLYFLTNDGKNTGKSFNSVADAKKAGLDFNDVFIMDGKRVTLGRLLVDSTLPMPLRDPTRILTKKVLTELLTDVAKDHKNKFAQVITSLKDLGNQYSHEWGATISIDDLNIDRKYRDSVVTKAWEDTKKKPENIVDIFMEAKTKAIKIQDRQEKDRNRMYDMLTSGSMGKKKNQVDQLLTMPGIFTNVYGEPIPMPVTKSFGEGLDTMDYWNSMYAARKGAVDRAVNTQDTGALNKALLSVTKSFLVVEDDCGTTKGLETPLLDKDVMDRCLAKDYPGVGKKNDIVDGEIVQKAQLKRLKSLLVRSPLTCESANGVCVFCYGLMPDGELPNIGENVGVLDSHAITERATQLTMRTFHTGGVAEKGKTVTGSFPELIRLLSVPKTVPGKAVLVEKSGTVEDIKPNPLGGVNVFVSGKDYHILNGKDLIVKIGDRVKKGDQLSSGPIKPQELANLKDHLTAQKYIVEQMNNIYNDAFHKKTLETIIKGVSNNAEITEAPDDSGYIRGDKATITYLDKLNKERKSVGQDEIKYRPFFKAIQTWNVDNEDWLSRLTANRLKQTIQEGVSSGMASNIHGNDPMPAYLYGLEFGQTKDPAVY